MGTPLFIALLTLAAPQADTTFAVEPDTRLEVSNFQGEVVVETWDRNEVRVTSDLDDRDNLSVERAGTVVRLRTRSRFGPGGADLSITVPRWLDLRIAGNQVDVEVRGVEGQVQVETVTGDIRVDGGRELVTVQSVQGDVAVRRARGRVEVRSVNEDIELTDIEGEIFAEASNGDITLRDIRSTRVRATSVNGEILYAGTIAGNGQYALTTHNGDVEVTVPEGADVTVSVSTFQGEFNAGFPVQLTGVGDDREFTFTLGTGTARLQLESFNGEIRLRRPR